MFGFLVFCIIIFIVFSNAKRQNDENKKRAARLKQQTTQQTAQTSSDDNRALQSMRTKANAPDGAAAPQKEMPIEARRRQQREAADRSRIHQSLHKGETVKNAAEAAKNLRRKAAEEIRFEDGELMREVYDIMVCGYPGSRSNQRDFLAEGMALLDRYQAS